ncbi:MAG: hemolysin family protein [Phycisphaeraceae bacterium]
MELSIIITVVATLLGTYLAACNVALKTFSRRKLEELLESQGRQSAMATFTQRLPKLQLMTGLLRTASSLLVLLAVLDLFVGSYQGWVAYGLAFVCAGSILAVFTVAIATSWGRYTPEGLIAASLPVLYILYFILTPVLQLLNTIDPLVRRVSGVDLVPADELSDDVLSVVEDHKHGGNVNEIQKQMLEAVFDLPNTTAGEIMTPRTDVKGIDTTEATLPQIRDAVTTIGYSRIPLYEESLDQIIGLLYARDLIKYLGDAADFDLDQILREPYLVPESKSVADLLAEFQRTNQHMAIVLDEYGGTAGLITIEDILEEIVGEIRDEYEEGAEPDPTIYPINEHAADIDARVSIDEVNDRLDLELPEDDDFDTIGGFVLSHLGHIPKQDETFDLQGVRFTVVAAEKTRVVRVRIEKLDELPAAPDDNAA